MESPNKEGKFIYVTPQQKLGMQKWIDALRSGEFKQVRRSYHLCGEYCCLGVLCEINNLIPGNTHAKFKLEELGFSVGDMFTFIEMNDKEKYTFNEIAQVLEDYLYLCEYANEIE